MDALKLDCMRYIQQKKEKIIAQSKTVLPKLEGIVDEALIKDYNQNVKLITAQKNLQYFPSHRSLAKFVSLQ